MQNAYGNMGADEAPSRKQIAIRLAYTLVYLIVFEVVKGVVQAATIFQFLYLLITQKHSEPVRRFTNRASMYAYRILRYITLNSNGRPFPFSDFPSDEEPPESERVNFG
ncbi:MAG: DUF4389 domain-containing protein [Syntrophobacteraceae bacterium]|jgi:hypothetical protein